MIRSALPAILFCLTANVQAQTIQDTSLNTLRDSVRNSLLLQEITVTESTKRYTDRIAGSNYIINRADFKRIQPIGTEEILRTVPGLMVQGDMGISNRLNVGIRGSNPRRSTRVMVMEDNVAMACAPYLDPQVYYNTPPERLEGIEVIKGAEMLAIGGQSTYGAINYITRTPNYKPRWEVNLQGGNNNYLSGLLNYGGRWKNVAADFGVLYKKFDGFIDNNNMESVNVTGKVFIDFTDRSRGYLKINHHDENYNTTYFGLTPFTFRVAPKSNPFDADVFDVKRTALDLGQEWDINNSLKWLTTAYYSNFDYDWWRQNTALVAASNAQAYLGNDIFNQRYGYLAGRTGFGQDDWIRVGQVRTNMFRENTGNRLRNFKNSGIRSVLQHTAKGLHWKNELYLGVHVHHERFRNSFLTADSSRFARSGRLTTDQLNLLTSTAVYLREQFSFKDLTATLLLRYENVRMTNQNILALSANPNLTGPNDARLLNKYCVFLPGINLQYQLLKNRTSLQVFGGYWKGFLPPTAGFGFFTVDPQGNVVTTNITPSSNINIEPETSNSFELGTRIGIPDQILNAELTYFNNTIQNFYSTARNEAFQSLGSVRIQGLELSVDADLGKWLGSKKHRLNLGVNGSLTWSRILSGVSNDALIFSQATIHSAASRDEMVNKINSNRGAYNVFLRRANGSDSLITRNISAADFAAQGAAVTTGRLQRLEMLFGSGLLSNNRVPFIAPLQYAISMQYGYAGLSLGAVLNHVGRQYSEFMNLENETADGGLGEVPAFQTIDLNARYQFSSGRNRYLQHLSLFASIKNLTNQVFIASRLHRNEGGIMPGGFRMVTAGFSYRF